MLKILRDILRFLHSVVWWTDYLVILILGLFFDAVVWPGNRDMYRKSEQFWAWSLMKIGGIRLEITGRENLPKDETVVYMPNHQSNLDWPIISWSSRDSTSSWRRKSFSIRLSSGRT